jgi:hypothetical protein
MMAGVFFWNTMKTPKKIFITWNPIAGTSQIKGDEGERVGNSSVAISIFEVI